VYQWRRRWRAGGDAALASKGAGGAVCRLSAGQVARLRGALEGGPAAWGWDEDQRWTLARVAALIGRLFHVRYTLRGTSYLLHRLGYAPQVPVHRAAERDEQAIARGRPRPGPGFEASGGDRGVCVLRGRGRAEPAPAEGADLGTPRPDPGGPRVRQGLRAGLGGGPGVPEARRAGPSVYRVRIHRGRKGERRSMSEADYADLITAPHQQLQAPVILIWDRLNTHVSAVMRAFISSHPGWLTEVRLPAYAPELNPAEGSGRP